MPKTKKQIAAEKKCAEEGHDWNYGDVDGPTVVEDKSGTRVQCGRCSVWGSVKVEPITPATFKTVGWEAQCREWREIEAEMVRADPGVVSWEVTVEQQRRMNERGERLMSPTEVNEEMLSEWVDDEVEFDFESKFDLKKKRW
jgi:hypothetical protein